MTEILTEKGRIIRVSKDLEIELIEKEKCDKCGYNDYCKIKLERKIIVPNNYYNLKIGDEVLIEVKGNSILYMSFYLYGIPLILFLMGIFLGLNLFKSSTELFSTTIGLFLVSIYYFFVKCWYEKKLEDLNFKVKIEKI